MRLLTAVDPALRNRLAQGLYEQDPAADDTPNEAVIHPDAACSTRSVEGISVL